MRGATTDISAGTARARLLADQQQRRDETLRGRLAIWSRRLEEAGPNALLPLLHQHLGQEPRLSPLVEALRAIIARQRGTPPVI
ncbi:hypothetical protein [Rhizosaccharibacter radicis]|uniref:Uncharacterized protein n=1 Tax=Rhizosaccharibacter radicis TaxID=2782605 RepID=A0ABT1VYI4_9PROT|nr:hypothetical protein [Acetobacteraceae bacterium KSS12]